MYPGARVGSAAAGSGVPSGVSRATNDPTMSRTSSQQQQLAADHLRPTTTSGSGSGAAAEAGSRASGSGKVKSEKASGCSGGGAVDHYVQRVGPYPTPQQYMLNKRAKYAAAAAPTPAEVLHSHIHLFLEHRLLKLQYYTCI